MNKIKRAFERAIFCAKIPGITLLQSPSDENKGELVVVTPRGIGGAVKRNKLRRQIKSIYQQEKLYEKKVIAIVLVYPEALKLSFEQIKKFLCQAFNRIDG